MVRASSVPGVESAAMIVLRPCAPISPSDHASSRQHERPPSAAPVRNGDRSVESRQQTQRIGSVRCNHQIAIGEKLAQASRTDIP